MTEGGTLAGPAVHITASNNSTQRTTLSIYDPEEGPALWAADTGLGVLFSLCLAQALVGNVLILVLLVRYKPYISANAFTVLAVTLSISDIIMVLLSGVPNVVSLLQMRRPLPQRFCDVSGFALNFNNRLNSFVTTCICLVRCLVVVMPIKARILLTKRALVLMVGGCVMLASFYSSLPFLFNRVTEDQITNYQYLKWVGFCMFFVGFYESRFLSILSTLLIEMVFFAPFIVAIVTCSVLLYTLNRRNKYIGLEQRSETKRSAVVVIIRVTILTLICVTPQLAFSIYEKLNRPYNLYWFSLRTEMYLNYMFGQQLIIYLRASINPLIIDMPAYLRRGKAMRRNAMAMKNQRKLSTAFHTQHSEMVPSRVMYKMQNSVGAVTQTPPPPNSTTPTSGLTPNSTTPTSGLTRNSTTPTSGLTRNSTTPTSGERHRRSLSDVSTATSPSVLAVTPRARGEGDVHTLEPGAAGATPQKLNGHLVTEASCEESNKDASEKSESGSNEVVKNVDSESNPNISNAPEEQQTGREMKRCNTDSCLHRGKVLNRTYSANWSQKFLT